MRYSWDINSTKDEKTWQLVVLNSSWFCPSSRCKKNIWVALGPWSPLSYVLNTHVFKMQHIKHAKSTRAKTDKQTTNQPTYIEFLCFTLCFCFCLLPVSCSYFLFTKKLTLKNTPGQTNKAHNNKQHCNSILKRLSCIVLLGFP